jgi:phosphate transport system substrate-binding protein
MVTFRKDGGILAAVLALSLIAAACGGDDDGSGGGDAATGATGSLNISGSSTVEPITSLVSEKFLGANPDVQIAVDGPGTSDGFELFCNGETDINDASRAIDDEEAAACEENGVTPIEIEVALDALSVIGNPANPLTCLSFGDLYALLGPEAEGFGSWSEADALAAEVGGNGGFPDSALTVVAPGEESGTYGSFIDIVIADLAEGRGADEALRADYQISPDDNVIVENAAGSEGGLGFVGFAFAEIAGDTVKEFEIDGGDGCVAPSADAVANGSYPISRSLYIYVSAEKLAENPALQPFVDFYLSDEGLASVSEVQYIDLPADRIEAARSTWATESG